MQPRPIAETSSPLFPNCRFSIVRLLPLCPLLSAFPNLQSQIYILQSHIPHLPKCNLLHRLFHGRREIIKRKRALVLIQSKITHDVVGIGAQFVGEISDGIVVAEGDEKIDVLKHNYYLNNEFYDLKH
jgi:hypothetical protein